MLGLLAKIWEGVSFVLRLILPATFAKMQRRARYGGEEIAGRLIAAKDAGKDAAKVPGAEPAKVAGTKAGGWGSGFLRVVAVLLLIAILVGLYYVGKTTKLWGIVRADNVLIPFYLPALALLLYGLLWLGWYLMKLLATEKDVSLYPDIDTAWSEAMGALDQVGIDLKSAPLFLVFGKPAGTEEALFDASGVRLSVNRVPPRAGAPLHVYAGPDAIFVTCAGVSLLGDLADILAGVKEPVMDGEADGQPSIMLGGGTRLPNANFIRMQKILRGAGGRKLTDEEQRELAKLCARDDARQGHMVDRAKQSLLKDPHKVAESTARLRRLCQLIARDRRPFCSANGMLFLLPAGGAASDSDASLTGDICQRDYAEARSALQVDCPVFAMVCDVETLPGFRDFRASFAEEELSGRLGQSFPFVPDVPEEQVAARIDESIQWIGDATLPGWVYKFFQVEKTASPEEAAEMIRKNARLYQFLATLRERIRRLSRVVTHGLLEQSDAHPMFPGCYLAGTGRSESDRAFVAGVFRRLLREDAQNAVGWTQQALDQEAEYQRLLSTGYMALAVLAVADVAMIILAVLVFKQVV